MLAESVTKKLKPYIVYRYYLHLLIDLCFRLRAPVPSSQSSLNQVFYFLHSSIYFRNGISWSNNIGTIIYFTYDYCHRIHLYSNDSIVLSVCDYSYYYYYYIRDIPTHYFPNGSKGDAARALDVAVVYDRNESGRTIIHNFCRVFECDTDLYVVKQHLRPNHAVID